MSRSLKLSLALVGIVAVVIGVLLVLNGGDTASQPETASAERLVRANSPRLSKGGEVEFVEFLDFECEACIALFPTIEELRKRYGNRVTFVVRHMPLHNNSVAAALAAEAAAEQGRFEDMYRRLFARPSQWGHREDSQRSVFFSYAEELGLDMDRFERTYEDPSTLARVEQSKRDGLALGVKGTPTFFLNGGRLNPESVEDLEQSLRAALAG